MHNTLAYILGVAVVGLNLAAAYCLVHCGPFVVGMAS